jgi:hypothetical protein
VEICFGGKRDRGGKISSLGWGGPRESKEREYFKASSYPHDFLTQIKVRRLGGFSDEQRVQMLEQIRDRILYWTYTLGQMKALNLGDNTDTIMSTPLNLFASEHKDEVDKTKQKEQIAKILPMLIKIWEPGSAICQYFESMPLMSSFQCEKIESDERIMSMVSILCQEGYTVSDDDILFFRRTTSGKSKVITYNHGNLIDLSFQDFGGQRLERHSWKDVKKPWGVVFIVAIDCYNRIDEASGLNALGEKCKKSNGKISALQDGIDCCKAIAEQCIETNVPMILLLNKVDLFEKKVAKDDLGRYFPAYKGGIDVGQAKKFVKNLFLKKVKESYRESKLFHTHFISMVDGNAVEKILQSVQRLVMEQNLMESFRER